MTCSTYDLMCTSHRRLKRQSPETSSTGSPLSESPNLSRLVHEKSLDVDLLLPCPDSCTNATKVARYWAIRRAGTVFYAPRPSSA